MGSGHNGGRRPGPPPFGEIPGSVWDGYKYYKMDPKLARVSTKADHLWDQEPCLSVQEDSGSSTSRGAEAAPVPSSAFHCTPASPPAAFLGHLHGDRRLAAIPRNQYPSLAASNRYKRARLQAHTSTLHFHSRDNVFYQTITDVDGLISPVEQLLADARVEQSTGAVLWTQATHRKALQSFSVDLGGRKRCRDQKVIPSNPRMAYYTSIDPDDYDTYHWQSGIGATNSPHPLAAVIEQQTRTSTEDIRHARHMAFTPSGSGLRGIETLNFTHLATADSVYDEDDEDMDNVSESLPWFTTLIRPNEHWAARNSSLAHHFKVPSMSQEELQATGSLDFECVVSVLRRSLPGGHKIDSIRILPSTIPAAPCPRFIQTADPWNNVYHTALCVNRNTGLCWVGFRSGSIQVIDIVDMFRKRVDSDCTKRYTPTVAKTPCRKAVTNLIAVGPADAIAAYSDGSLVRLRKPLSDVPAYVVQEYTGHVNDGNMHIAACADAESQLIAVCGTDGFVRIWHFDDSKPLNSPWHQLRNGVSDGDRDLAPDPDEIRNKRLVARTKKPNSECTSECVTESDVFKGPFGELALSPLNDEPFESFPANLQTAVQKPLSELRTGGITCMSFVHTSWVADRDAQWEHTREFDDNCRPRRLYRAGPLPALCVGIQTEAGPRLLYFEHPSALAAV